MKGKIPGKIQQKLNKNILLILPICVYIYEMGGYAYTIAGACERHTMPL